MDIEALSAKIAELDMEITKLTAQAEIKKPWYLEISTIAAVLALLFSFGTTLVSYNKAIKQ